jgi:hypothetical protein
MQLEQCPPEHVAGARPGVTGESLQYGGCSLCSHDERL